MNERFRELMAQAGFDPAAIERMGVMPNAEKLADLIVRECVDVIQQEVSMKYKDGVGETEEFMGGHYAASVLARTKIKKHFGVEE